MKSSTVLAFDYGLTQIGVAVGTTMLASANPLSIVKAKDGTPNWQVIEKLIKEWQPAQLIVGLPLNMDGSEADMSKRARKFAQRLHGRFGLTVELHDERLSSREARSLIADGEWAGKPLAHDKIDALAATVILESWLQYHHKSR